MSVQHDYRPDVDEPVADFPVLVAWFGGFIWGAVCVLGFVEATGGF